MGQYRSVRSAPLRGSRFSLGGLGTRERSGNLGLLGRDFPGRGPSSRRFAGHGSSSCKHRSHSRTDHDPLSYHNRQRFPDHIRRNPRPSGSRRFPRIPSDRSLTLVARLWFRPMGTLCGRARGAFVRASTGMPTEPVRQRGDRPGSRRVARRSVTGERTEVGPGGSASDPPVCSTSAGDRGVRARPGRRRLNGRARAGTPAGPDERSGRDGRAESVRSPTGPPPPLPVPRNRRRRGSEKGRRPIRPAGRPPAPARVSQQ